MNTVKEINILILSAGRRVELVNLFRKALDRADISGNVVAADCSDSAPALYFADRYYIVPRIASDDYLNTLVSVCRKEKISLIVPTIDTELVLLSQNKAEIEKSTNAKVMICDPEYVSICNDKEKTAKFFREKGFCVPHIYSGEELSEKLEYPLIVKPRDGSSSINVFRVENREQLEFFLKYVKDPIVQECAIGKEYTIDVFCDFSGKAITVVPRLRVATRSGEILKGRIEKIAGLMEIGKKIAETIHAIGHITIQGFWGEDAVFRLIEINPRFGGGAPMSIMAGADSCANLIRLLQGETLEYNENFEDGAFFARFDQSVRI